jgi:cytochrome c peroxidase
VVSRRAAVALVSSALLAALAAAAARVDGRPSVSHRVDDDAPFAFDLPAGFPAPRVPSENPMTTAKVELGRRLFHDPRLSYPGTLACAGCHKPELAYTDGRAHAVGVAGDLHPRSSMSLANVAYNPTLGWDDPSLKRLEDQVLVPLLNTHPIEMGLEGHEAEVLARLAHDRAYARAFRRAFPGEEKPVSLENVARALASFLRTLISGDSPFDRWSRGAEITALSPDERAGARLFFSKRVGCFHCHSGFNLAGAVDYDGAEPAEPPHFHNTGLYDLDGHGAYPPLATGAHRLTGRPEDMGAFRAPTLRNVALTAPYMHDGSIATLEEVVDHYAAGGRAPRPQQAMVDSVRDAQLNGFELTSEERAQLVAFLRALTDEAFLSHARELSRH